ncbi:MAG: cyclic nucleotide-binding domain-containing protein [Lachnospiraceae bacterium]|jgi:CRP-like cAMP-binding protein|nr:cyclic nucleotide-binding domain-containing protein [Lachnospiraceae bacterium]
MITKVNFKKGDLIFRAGEPGNSMFEVVGKGHVGLFLDYGLSTEFMESSVTTDEFFGELAVLGVAIRRYTAKAMSDVTLNMIGSADFDEYIKQDSAKAYKILTNASACLRDLTSDYKRACTTLAQYVDAKEKGGDIPGELLNKMKNYAKR